MKDKLKPYILPIFLAIAVLISLLLSVTLLIDPVRFGVKSNQSKSANLKSGGIFKSNSDIYAPIGVIQNPNRNQGTQNLLNSQKTNLTGSLYKNVRSYIVNDVTEVSKNNRDKYFQTLNRPNSLVLFYGAPIPEKMISDSFNDNGSDDGQNVSRIVLPLNDGSHMYLLNDNKYEISTVTVRPHTVNNIKEIISSGVTKIPIQIRLFNDRPFLYYPKDVQMNNLGYLMQEQSQTNLINQVMGSNADTKVTRSNKITSYSGNDQLLSFDAKDNVKYNNYQAKNSYDYQSILDNAYQNVLNLGIPLENINFDNYNTKTKTVSYRSYLQGFPVFSNQRMGMATYSLSGSSHSQSDFSLLNFQVPIPTNQPMTTLPNSEKVLNDLSKKGMDMKKITDLSLGYQVITDKKNKLLVTLQPSWFVRYNGDWINYQSVLSKAGRKVN